MDTKIIDKRYFHLSNSGVTIEVSDRGYGPMVTVSSRTFGNLQQDFSFYCDTECLAELGKMFTEAAQQKFSKEYVCAVKYEDNKDYKERVMYAAGSSNNS